MTTFDSTLSLPNDAQRLAVRVRSAGYAVMYQEWRDLLFLHWEYSAAAIQATLPEGLFEFSSNVTGFIPARLMGFGAARFSTNPIRCAAQVWRPGTSICLR
jgi:hypothetical protein